MSYTDYDFPHNHFYETDLRELLCKFKNTEDAIKALNEWKDEVNPKIEDILAIWDAVESGQLPPAMQEAIRKWLSVNAIDLLGELVKTVFFGLTDDGHFVAWIPDSWDDISFNTTWYDIILEAHPEIEYGHLVLSY